MQFNREQIRTIIAYNQLKGLSVDECYNDMVQVLHESAPDKSTVFRWYRNFNNGKTTVEDDPHGSRPITATTPENIEMVKKLIEEDRKITCLQLAAKVRISSERVFHIIHHHLKLRVCTRWVPHFLTEYQKQVRVNLSREILEKFKNGSSKFWCNVITGDEIYVYYYDPPTRRESQIWVFENEEPPTNVKLSKTVGKILYAVFFRSNGLVKAIRLSEQKTVTASWYTETCLPQVFETVQNQRPKTGLRGLILHHDNARPHTAKVTTEYLERQNMKILPHPPYSPDLAPCDFWLFGNLKKSLRNRRFASEEELDDAVNEYLQSIQKNDWERVFHLWQDRYKRCIELQGEYVTH